MVFFLPFYWFFEICQFFLLHFHYDNFQILETFWLRNVRSGHDDHFQKKKQESDKRVKNYERILQTVPIILRDTLIRSPMAYYMYTAWYVGAKSSLLAYMDPWENISQ